MAFKCLKALVADKELPYNHYVVGLEKFGNLLNWFGPLQPENRSTTINHHHRHHMTTITTIIICVGTLCVTVWCSKEFFDGMEELLRQKWFHGTITTAEAEDLLISCPGIQSIIPQTPNARH